MKAKISHKLLKIAISKLNAKKILHPWHTRLSQSNSWVSFDLSSQADDVRSLSETQLPFLCEDGVFRTIDDFRDKKPCSQNMVISAISFSRNALEASILIARQSDLTTTSVEELGRNIRCGNSTSDEILRFSQAVCKWGRGERVSANLKRHNDLSNLKTQLKFWLTNIDKDNLQDAISNGLKIKGLGVSFASKHLRMLAPDRFGVLDEVLNLGLGFSLNSVGYEFFINEIAKIIQTNDLKNNIADVESGIFQMTRQIVRSK